MIVYAFIVYRVGFMSLSFIVGVFAIKVRNAHTYIQTCVVKFDQIMKKK